ncbi:MAG: hypothetical protein L7U59_05940 [Flavobacteriaceae bacterium]|nr:hypothetical protein [Flavobacteriaceae bacterium]MBT6127337.1 hypothetical protein [Flavobacteriaceae bacterium]MCH1453935.1 hypothetical protein [Flavobacteriaceae bacterium]
MKKFTLIALSFGLITSCSEDGVSGFSENLSTTTVMETINSIAFEEDIDELVSESMNLNSNASSARSADTTADKGPKKFMGDKYGDCATVVEDEENNTKTITFSEDCEGKRGQTRSGTMIVTYSETQGEAGSFRQVTYDDFYLNGVKIEGTRRTEIISIDENGSKTMRTSMTDGKMIYEDGTFKTKNSEMTRYTHVENDEKQYSSLTGSKSAVSTEGVSFSMQITTPIKFVYNCDDLGFRKRGKIPVEGIKVSIDGDQTITTDFGDGTCDTLVEVTKDGEVETVDLKDLKRGGRFKNILKKKRKKI